MYDIAVIGSGAAGLSAALYAKRAGFSVVVVEEMPLSGGQIVNSAEVDNYIGIPQIDGFELAQKFRSHVDLYNVEFKTARAVEIKNFEKYKTLSLDSGENISALAIIIATGAKHKSLGVPGEERLKGRGVSYCASCDGPFYKNKITAVVGGGNTALEYAIYLSRICKKVYLIHRRDEFRGAKILSDNLKELENVELLLNCVVERINGDKILESIDIKNRLDNSVKTIRLDGIFAAVGVTPDSGIAKGLLRTDSDGYIVADETCAASVEGIFAAGDVRTKQVRQIITAAADGASAVASAEEYIAKIKK